MSNASVSGSCAINYEFEPIPSKILQHIDNPRAIHLLMAISNCIRRGIIGPSVEYLGSMIGVTREWTHKLIKKLKAAGVLLTIRRRISARRNDTNLYQIVGFNPRSRCEVEFTEVLRDVNANTKAPEPAAPARVQHPPRNDEKTRYMGKIRQLENRIVEQATFFKNWVTKGQHQQWRDKQSTQSSYLASVASTGLYRSEEAERDAENWRRLDELQKARHNAILDKNWDLASRLKQSIDDFEWMVTA